MDTIEKRLLAFRQTTGMHKRSFSERINLDSGLYGRYEAGTTKPSFETLEKIAASFPKLSLNWLLTGRGEMLMASKEDASATSAPKAIPSGTGYTVQDGRVTSSSNHDVLPVGSLLGPGEHQFTAPTPGLTSGPATVAEAENVLLRQQLADKDKLIDRLWNMIPQKLGKLMSNLDAAREVRIPYSYGSGVLASFGG